MAASSNIIVTYAGNGQSGFSGDGGPSTAARMRQPTDVFLDNAANIFVADTQNNRVRKVNAAQVITTVAGNGQGGFSGDGGPAISARFDTPTALWVTGSGVLYIADTGNNRIRKVVNGVVTTVAGNGQSGYSGDGGPATSAKLREPTSIVVDSSGNLYFSDTGNNVVRKISTGGTISTFAGKMYSGGSREGGRSCRFSGNGGAATNAFLCAPTGLGVSGSNIYISDSGNNQVRKVTGGIITAFAGTGSGGFSGDNGQATAARLRTPIGVADDPLGDVYIVDSGNKRVRQVTTSGVISTFAGTGQAGYSGDGGPAELAKINPVGGITTDASNVFFADTNNNRVRRIHKDGPPPALPEAPFGQNILLAGGAAIIFGAGAMFVVRRNRKRGAAAAA
jgi:sugar lactone lactonase YvrE